ncbi:MAG: phosphohydrolase [Deltaproteobacteria bacterium SG8_13]|nr:MAG: phosphohydrolase [Deltaproteobacteria bacterium SG8_13]
MDALLNFESGNCRPVGLSEEMLAALQSQVKSLFEAARGSHAWDHTQRVFRLCEKIGREEKADMDVVRVAALLHDIGRARQDDSNGQVCHARKGAEMAAEMIQGLPVTEAQKQNILHCIRSHRFRGERRPETTEAAVLFDADKIDAIGAVGVARAFLFAGEVGARLHNPDIRPQDGRPYSEDDTGYREYCLKLCKIKDGMLTDTGRVLADERHRFMEEFFTRFLNEYEGKG